MKTYVCKSCKKPQYSASEEKANEPCIYCGGVVELVMREQPKEAVVPHNIKNASQDGLHGQAATLAVNAFAQEIHQNAIDHGWWETTREFGTIIALCHSELSEALEEHRNGRPVM